MAAGFGAIMAWSAELNTTTAYFVMAILMGIAAVLVRIGKEIEKFCKQRDLEMSKEHAARRWVRSLGADKVANFLSFPSTSIVRQVSPPPRKPSKLASYDDDLITATNEQYERRLKNLFAKRVDDKKKSTSQLASKQGAELTSFGNILKPAMEEESPPTSTKFSLRGFQLPTFGRNTSASMPARLPVSHRRIPRSVHHDDDETLNLFSLEDDSLETGLPPPTSAKLLSYFPLKLMNIRSAPSSGPGESSIQCSIEPAIDNTLHHYNAVSNFDTDDSGHAPSAFTAMHDISAQAKYNRVDSWATVNALQSKLLSGIKVERITDDRAMRPLLSRGVDQSC